MEQIKPNHMENEMAYIVVYQRPNGSSAVESCMDLASAVEAAERLRNSSAIERPRIFETSEIRYDFQPYYRVKVVDPKTQKALGLAADDLEPSFSLGEIVEVEGTSPEDAVPPLLDLSDATIDTGATIDEAPALDFEQEDRAEDTRAEDTRAEDTAPDYTAPDYEDHEVPPEEPALDREFETSAFETSAFEASDLDAGDLDAGDLDSGNLDAGDLDSAIVDESIDLRDSQEIAQDAQVPYEQQIAEQQERARQQQIAREQIVVEESVVVHEPVAAPETGLVQDTLVEEIFPERPLTVEEPSVGLAAPGVTGGDITVDSAGDQVLDLRDNTDSFGAETRAPDVAAQGEPKKGLFEKFVKSLEGGGRASTAGAATAGAAVTGVATGDVFGSETEGVRVVEPEVAAVAPEIATASPEPTIDDETAIEDIPESLHPRRGLFGR